MRYSKKHMRNNLDVHSLCCNDGQSIETGIFFDDARKVVGYDRLCKCTSLTLKTGESILSYDTKNGLNEKLITCVFDCERETVGYTSVILKGSNDEEVKMCLSNTCHIIYNKIPEYFSLFPIQKSKPSTPVKVLAGFAIKPAK